MPPLHGLCVTCRHLLVTGSCDATCKSWDLRMGRQVCKYQHPDHFEEVRTTTTAPITYAVSPHDLLLPHAAYVRTD